MISLSVGLPGTIARFPDSSRLRADLRPSRRSPASAVCGPWQRTHFAARMGWTSRSKSILGCDAEWLSAAAGRMVPRNIVSARRNRSAVRPSACLYGCPICRSLDVGLASRIQFSSDGWAAPRVMARKRDAKRRELGLTHCPHWVARVKLPTRLDVVDAVWGSIILRWKFARSILVVSTFRARVLLGGGTAICSTVPFFS
jgi:hypothetical protein